MEASKLDNDPDVNIDCGHLPKTLVQFHTFGCSAILE